MELNEKLLLDLAFIGFRLATCEKLMMIDGRIQIVWRGRQAHFKTDYSRHTAVR
jgi:hypothetical protein